MLACEDVLYDVMARCAAREQDVERAYYMPLLLMFHAAIAAMPRSALCH